MSAGGWISGTRAWCGLVRWARPAVATSRGDLPAEVDEDLLIDLLSSPFFYRIFITGHRVDPDLAEKLVDFVLVREIPKKAAARR
jgi:Tetracyclin repressor-like, C-terminal domain